MSDPQRPIENLRDFPTALADVITLVEADATDRPEAYLAETIVPEGGE